MNVDNWKRRDRMKVPGQTVLAKWPFLTVAMLLLLVSAGFPVNAQKVLLVGRLGEDPYFFIKNEVTPMMNQLAAEGYEIEVATSSGEPIGLGSDSLNCDIRLLDVPLDNYVAVVVPCMGAGDSVVPKNLAALIKKADSMRMPIAAQHSLEVLGPAGLLTRKISMGPGVVVDGNLVTSYNCPLRAKGNGRPIDTEELIKALVAVIRSR
jgi:hypothetical protein